MMWHFQLGLLFQIRNEASGDKVEKAASILTRDDNRKRRQEGSLKMDRQQDKKEERDSSEAYRPHTEHPMSYNDGSTQTAQEAETKEVEQSERKKRRMRKPRPINGDLNDTPPTKLPLHALLVNIAASRKVFNGSANASSNAGGSPSVTSMAHSPPKHLLPPPLLEFPSRPSVLPLSAVPRPFNKVSPSLTLPAPTLPIPANPTQPMATFMVNQTPAIPSFNPHGLSQQPQPLSPHPHAPSTIHHQGTFPPSSQMVR